MLYRLQSLSFSTHSHSDGSEKSLFLSLYLIMIRLNFFFVFSTVSLSLPLCLSLPDSPSDDSMPYLIEFTICFEITAICINRARFDGSNESADRQVRATEHIHTLSGIIYILPFGNCKVARGKHRVHSTSSMHTEATPHTQLFYTWLQIQIFIASTFLVDCSLFAKWLSRVCRVVGLLLLVFALACCLLHDQSHCFACTIWLFVCKTTTTTTTNQKRSTKPSGFDYSRGRTKYGNSLM